MMTPAKNIGNRSANAFCVIIHEFFRKTGVFLIILPFILFTLFACVRAEPDRQSGQWAGGPCQYKNYPGKATILSIASRKADHPDQIKRFDVKFSFTPQENIHESFARTEGKTFNLYGYNFQYPDGEFITEHDIHIGRILDGSLQVIVSGTCTPVWFDFPALKQGK